MTPATDDEIAQAEDSGECPRCGSEMDWSPEHERDSSNDRHFCPKCRFGYSEMATWALKRRETVACGGCGRVIAVEAMSAEGREMFDRVVPKETPWTWVCSASCLMSYAAKVNAIGHKLPRDVLVGGETKVEP